MGACGLHFRGKGGWEHVECILGGRVGACGLHFRENGRVGACGVHFRGNREGECGEMSVALGPYGCVPCEQLVFKSCYPMCPHRRDWG